MATCGNSGLSLAMGCGYRCVCKLGGAGGMFFESSTEWEVPG